MVRTLVLVFESWLTHHLSRYELESKGLLGENFTKPVPDIYMRNQELDDQVNKAPPFVPALRNARPNGAGNLSWSPQCTLRHDLEPVQVVHLRVQLAKMREITAKVRDQ